MTTLPFDLSEDQQHLFCLRIIVDDGCWTIPGKSNNAGYTQVAYNSKWHLAHRIAYQILVGPIPEGLDLDHLCRNRACVRPDHLEPVTRSENIQRGYNARRAAATV